MPCESSHGREFRAKWANRRFELKSRDAQSRRRRLLHRGLLGELDQQPDDAEDSALIDAAESGYDEEEAAERAARAVLSGRDSWANRQEDVIDERDSPPAVLKAARESPQRDAGLATIQTLLRGTRPVTWVFTGDNVIQGACCTEGWRSCVEIFSERVRSELRRGWDVIINTGVSGDTASQLLATWKRRVSRYRPEVVVISLGINDCKSGVAGREDFRRTMREILERIRTEGAIPLVILPHPVYLPATRQRADLRAYVEILRQELAREEVPGVDHWSDWLQHWPDLEATRSRLFDGRIQLNADAHRHLAGLLFQTLEIFDPRSAVCSAGEIALS